MSSLVVFPFKTENPDVVVANIAEAAAHERVGSVLCVGYEEESTFRAIAGAVPEISESSGTPIDLVVQDRIGDVRPGKGDGMNTALQRFLATDHDRIHFYDADITSFDDSWITKAERAADLGYGVVRHYFPRSSTDAMITWMVTRASFAMLFPTSELPWIEQPLGGELLISRSVAELLVDEPLVTRRSDWGIDTVLTFEMVRSGVPLYETYVPRGKAHALYGGLDDLRTMLVECFDAVQGLRDVAVPGATTHRVEPPTGVPASITTKLGYDLEATMHLLLRPWSDRQVSLLERFPTPVRDAMIAGSKQPRFAFLDDGRWFEVLEVALSEFELGDDDWEEVLFRLWVTRVLAYTTNVALRGYDHAQRSLQQMVQDYLLRAALR